MLAALARLAVAVFFRRVEVAGAQRVPKTGPLLILANHVNGLVDPALVLGFVPRPASFLAKSTLFELSYLRWLLDWARVIPVYRRQDEGADTAKNAETFSRCREVLAAGGTIALFPEGISHNEPYLMPLKTGAARIALETESMHAHARVGEWRPLGVQILPVGLLFDAKDTFRSRALVQIGEPFCAVEDRAAPTGREADEREEVLRLTGRIDAALRSVTLNYPSWEEARLLQKAADLYASTLSESPGGTGLAARFDLRQAFGERYAAVLAAHPRRVEVVRASMHRYLRFLRYLGVADQQVASEVPFVAVVRWCSRVVWWMFFTLPFALLGLVLNWLPYRLAGFLSARAGKTPDVRSTFKLYPSLVSFPLTWILEGLLCASLLEPWSGLALFAVAPLAGFVALRTFEEWARLVDQARTYLLLRTRRRMREKLRSLRGEVLRGVRSLVEVASEPQAAADETLPRRRE
jgi:1-acyl-sn-glycerol-3-phosphate acyltransferase